MRDLREEIRRRLARAPIEPTRRLEIVEEIGLDLEERYADLVARGTTPAQAEAAVLAELDAHDVLARELARVVRAPRVEVVPGAPGGGLLRDLGQDLRYAARALVKSKGFTAITLLSLALGIGANVAIFQVINAVHTRSLPVAAPDDLVAVEIKDRNWASGSFFNWHADLTNPIWERVRDRQQAFSSILAWSEDSFNVAPGGQVHNVRGLLVSGGFFNTLGVAPVLGRVFTAADDRRGCGAPGAVLSHGFWQHDYGGDPTAIGRKLSLGGHDVEIIGVAPPGFHGLAVGQSFDVAVPLCMESTFQGERSRLDVNHAWFLSAVGRLKPGWTMAKASAHLDSISQGIFDETVPVKYTAESATKYRAYRLGAFPAGHGISPLREEYTKPLWFLLCTAGLVLLIACANLANLLLARASAREREISLRLALGASRGRLIRQLMTESLLLALLGAGAGLWLAGLFSQGMVGFLGGPADPVVVNLAPDARVVGFTVGLAALTCVLFGLAPALRASRTDIGLVLKATGGHGATVARFGLRRLLVAAQVAMSFVLLVGALLFARSLRNLSSVDTGFDGGVLVLSTSMDRLATPKDQRLAMKASLLERVRDTPGVAAAASASIVPISGSFWNHHLTREGAPPPEGKEGVNAYFSRVSTRYFETMRTLIVAGRDFGPQDSLGAPIVGVVNEALAKALFPGQSPIGQRLNVGASSAGPPWTIEIIGVVENTKYGQLREDYQPLVFVAAAQDKDPFLGLDIVIRPSGSLADAVAGVKKAVAEVSPLIDLDVDYLDRMLSASLQRERLLAGLSGFFGALAALLATIGLYGVVAYGVARRTHEIGIRMALGADRGSISRMIVRETATLLALGLGGGVLLALAAGKAASSMLYGLAPYDPLTFGAALALMALVTFVAAAVPARRAAGVDPMVALKEE